VRELRADLHVHVPSGTIGVRDSRASLSSERCADRGANIPTEHSAERCTNVRTE